MSALPLSGIKILDLTRVLAGPLSAQMLADLGAEVIKIERPGGGDDARDFGPPYLVDPEGKENNNNSFYLCANRGKKSVTVNIASTGGAGYHPRTGKILRRDDGELQGRRSQALPAGL